MVNTNSTKNYFRYKERRNGELIGVLKYLHKGPVVFKEKHEDKLFKMPTRKEVEEKIKQILKKNFKIEDEETEQAENKSGDENDDAESQILKAMQNAMAKPNSKSDKQFKSLSSEMSAYDGNGKKSENLEKVHNGLLTIKPTSVASERAFSISGSIVTKRRARLSNDIVDDLCFSKDYFEKN